VGRVFAGPRRGRGGGRAHRKGGGQESWVPKMKKDFENAKELLTEH